MSNLTSLTKISCPTLVTASGERARLRFLEFFASNIRNPHTRRAYVRAVLDFMNWCQSDAQITALVDIEPLHVAAWIELQTRRLSAPSVKQHLAAIRHLFDWLVVGQIVATNPASSVRGPSHRVKTGKTPILDSEDTRQLLNNIDISKPSGLRDRALIALMVYSFARIGAALAMKVEDVYTQNRRLWVRLHEKGGKRHEMPCHHNLEEYLSAYINETNLRDDHKGFLFRTIGRGTGQLTSSPLVQANAHAMIQRHIIKSGIATKVGNDVVY